MMSTK